MTRFLFSIAAALLLYCFSMSHTVHAKANSQDFRILFQSLCGSIPGYLSQVLGQIPFERATTSYLKKNGSSVGIYYRKKVYLGDSILPDNRALFGQMVEVNTVSHESWHAYYDQLMPRSEYKNLRQYWDRYYGRTGFLGFKNDAECFGDEAIAMYLGGLSGLYAALASAHSRGQLTPTKMRMYENAYRGKSVRGYCGGKTANREISRYEIQVALRAAGDFFPAPEILVKVLDLRFKPSFFHSL